MSKKILLIGTHGQYNWGDDLLLETFLMRLGPEHRYFVNSYDPEGTRAAVGERFDVRTFHTTNDRIALLKHVFSADVVFFAGGTILRELYKTSGRNKYSSLLMVAALAYFSKTIARKTVLMSNIGMGPIETPTGQRIARLALESADFVAFRDKQSLDLTHAINARNRNMIVVPDAIYARDKSDFLGPESGRKQARGRSGKRPLALGLNLNFDIANPSNWEHFIGNLAESVKLLAERYDLEVRGIPMQTAFNPHNDVVTLREFKKLVPGVTFVEAIPKCPSDIGEEIAKCDVLVAERLHALVIASLVGTPFVALEYDVKIASLVKRLGMEDYGIDINREFGARDIAELVERALGDSENLKGALKRAADGYRRELDAYFDTITSRYV